MGHFETDEAKEYYEKVHRDITDGKYDGLINGNPMKDNYDGTHSVFINGKWKTRADDYYDKPDMTGDD